MLKLIMKVALIQQKYHNSKEKMVLETPKAVERASDSGSLKLVCFLQELPIQKWIPFCPIWKIREYLKYASNIKDDWKFWSNVARESRVVLVTSLFEERTAGIYHNSAVVFDSDGTLAGKYRKMHIPDDPGFYEKFYFTEGDLGFKPIETSIGKLGVLICWDQWFPRGI